ncbi:MAG: hypothetical protein NVS4B8_06950 [Herpetosiphon sp.]
MNKNIVRRLYLYAASFLGLQILLVGLRGVLSIILLRLSNPALVGKAPQFKENLRLSLALIICGLPLWAIHWWWAQRNIGSLEERQSALRRLYGYLVLLIAMLSLLFELHALFGALLVADQHPKVLPRLGPLLINLVVWCYHVHILRVDRLQVEQTGAQATLRRWYLVIIQAFSLGLAAYAAADVLDYVLQALVSPHIGSSSEVLVSVAGLLAGLVVWGPHHLWGRSLIRVATPIRRDEVGSTLRAVYAACIITVASIGALSALTSLLYEVLRHQFGSSGHFALGDHIWLIATGLIALVIWSFHRLQLLLEARENSLARIATAQRIIGYVTATIGLGALFFGFSGLLGSLLRLLFNSALIGSGWRTALSLHLALSIVALPVYSVAAGSMERKVRATPAEDQTLARRIYLYAVLLFGIVATVSALVMLVRLGLGVILGTTDLHWQDDGPRWLGYASVGGVVTILYMAFLRRASNGRSAAGSDRIVVIVANEPLGSALRTTIAGELPGITLRMLNEADVLRLPEMLVDAQTLIVSLPIALNAAVHPFLETFGGQRILLATNAPGYDVIGAKADMVLARDALRLIQSSLPVAVPPTTSFSITSTITA